MRFIKRLALRKEKHIPLKAHISNEDIVEQPWANERGNGKKEASSKKFSFPRLIAVPLSFGICCLTFVLWFSLTAKNSWDQERKCQTMRDKQSGAQEFLSNSHLSYLRTTAETLISPEKWPLDQWRDTSQVLPAVTNDFLFLLRFLTLLELELEKPDITRKSQALRS